MERVLKNLARRPLRYSLESFEHLQNVLFVCNNSLLRAFLQHNNIPLVIEYISV